MLPDSLTWGALPAGFAKLTDGNGNRMIVRQAHQREIAFDICLNQRGKTEQSVYEGRGALRAVRLSDGETALVRQYRHAVRAYVWELPAGRLDPHEAPEHAARRELEEEAGLRAGRLEKLLEFWTTPGFCDEAMHLYRATELAPVPPRPEDDERIEIRSASLDEARAMIARGDLREAKTLVALLLEGERRAREAP